MSVKIFKNPNELVFECPKCSTIWVQDKDSCNKEKHDGMVNGMTYSAVCPICGATNYLFMADEIKYN